MLIAELGTSEHVHSCNVVNVSVRICPLMDLSHGRLTDLWPFVPNMKVCFTSNERH